MDDPHDLERFVIAQDGGGTYATALAELRSGRKTSHWMWFVFPPKAAVLDDAVRPGGPERAGIPGRH